MKLLIRFFLLTWILSACAPLSAIKTNASQENLPEVKSTLEFGQDYIFYDVWESGISEVWAVNPETGDSLLITENNLGIGPWSPSGNYWLLEDSDSLYVAQADGTSIQRVYKFPEIDSCGKNALWLSEDVIMIDIWGCDVRGRAWPPPHQYYVNIKTGEDGRLDPMNEYDDYGTYLILGVIPHTESWIQFNSFTSKAEIADLKGHHRQILTELEMLPDDVGSWSMEFIPNTTDVIFKAWREDTSKPDNILNGLWKMSLPNKSPKLIIEEMPDTQIEEYHVSPDGKILAYAYARGPDYIVAFYDIQNQKVDCEWNFPYRLSSPRFEWSPDSGYIALPYSEYDYGTPNATSDGIQIMDISNGKTRLLIDKDVWIRFWHRIGY